MYTGGYYFCLVKRNQVQTFIGKTAQKLTIACVVSVLCLVFVNRAAAQADSLAYSLNITAIQSDFKKSCAMFQLNKFKLNTTYQGDGQSFFDSAWNAYELLYAKVPVQERGKFFTEAFYQDALYAAQLFRNISAVTKLTDNKQAVSGKQPVHEDKWGHEGHSHHKHQ